MTITNEQAMQELLAMQRKPESTSESLRCYDLGVLYGASTAYWRSGIISFAQYSMLNDTTTEQVPTPPTIPQPQSGRGEA